MIRDEKYNLTLLFWLFKAKARITGEAPIYARITITGKKRAQFATGIWIKPEQWESTGSGFVLGKNRLARSYNERLDNIRADINSIYADLERKKQIISPQLIKAIYTGEKDFAYSLLRMADVCVDKKKQNPELKKRTIEIYQVYRQHLANYLKAIKDEQIMCVEINCMFLAGFEEYLKTKAHCSQSYANRVLKFVRLTLDLAVQMQVCDYNPLHSYAFNRPKKKKKVFLNIAELKKLATYEFASKRLSRVAKLFVLQSMTGLSYGDLMRFDRSWITLGIDGREWIYGDRIKIDSSQYAIPLFPLAKQILEELEYKVPQISNGNYNAYLKEIAVVVGIDKHLTTHVGRKTFGNIMLEHGVSMEGVAGMYGHSTKQTTEEYYVEVSRQRIAKETAGLDF